MSDIKPSNPKDAVAVNKLPLDMVPSTLPVFAALAFTEGDAKYGAYNWRVAGVAASVYRAALERHMMSWWNGEDVDPKSGIPHLASVIACAGIILDAEVAGKLTDDRPPKSPVGDLIRKLESKVAHVRDVFKDHKPPKYTQAGLESPSSGS